MRIPDEIIPIAGMLMTVGIVGIVIWSRARTRELQFHENLRVKEMEHQRRMKELEIELEKAKSREATSRAA